MGVIYTLADHENKRLLCLDKCRYGYVERADYYMNGFFWTDRETFHSASAFERGSLILPSIVAARPWLERCVTKVRDFCEAARWNVSLLNDAEDDDYLLEAIGYRHIGNVMGCACANPNDHPLPPDVPVCEGCGWFLCLIGSDDHRWCAQQRADLAAKPTTIAHATEWVRRLRLDNQTRPEKVEA